MGSERLIGTCYIAAIDCGHRIMVVIAVLGQTAGWRCAVISALVVANPWKPIPITPMLTTT